ncbi:serine hydrolase domain-containing protein [Chitinophaga sp. NPDC101104]|uniref:serine hydrolase domain-containing protein n=1 Tax=Chitinophaga sp. NPDC101104 TaxID=3390561 RepID=UPI003D019922
MKKIALQLIAAFTCLSQYSNGQTPHDPSAIKSNNPLKTRLDSLVHRAAEQYMRSPVTFDLSIGIIKNGISHQYFYHRGPGPLSSKATLFGLGSIAKTFTGILLAKAVIDRKLQLDDDIRKYLPGQYPDLQYDGQPVRIADLANHTSGLPAMSREYDESYLDNIVKLPPRLFRDFYRVYTADSLFRDMHHFRPDTIPGTRYRYNGNAMMVLTAILERVYGTSYKELVTSFLRRQLGMAHTTPLPTEEEEKRLPPGHDADGKPLPFIPDAGFRAAPSMFSTPADMLRFAAANLESRNAAIRLSHQTTFTKPDGMRMGLGWMMGEEENGMPYIMHTGRDGCGFSALLYLYPDSGTAIILLVNDSSGQDRLAGLKDDLVRRFGQR